MLRAWAPSAAKSGAYPPSEGWGAKRPGVALLLFLLATLFSCNTPISTVIFHTEMGDMAVQISPYLPEEAAAALAQLVQEAKQPLAIEKVLQNGYIQLNLQDHARLHLPSGMNQAPVSGAFAWQNGKFFIIQGRAHTDETLDKWEQSTKQPISKESRAQLMQHGGALQLENNCLVLGKLVSGQATLDRIAALPNDADGRPLRSVSLQLEVLK